MLRIIFGDIENTIDTPAIYFNNQYDDEWITDTFSKEIIRDVDKSEVIGAHLINSPVLGPISPDKLSGGVKTLMLFKFDESGRIFNASACGDNCAKWIVEIAKTKELRINLHHIMNFDHIADFKAIIENTGKCVTNYEEYLDEAIDIQSKLSVM